MSQEEEAFLRYCSLDSCRARLEHFLRNQKKGVAHFYKNDRAPDTFDLDDASARASLLVESVVRHKLLGNDDKIKELVKDLAVLALYDMAILIDDSESMSYEEGGNRIEILKGVLSIINNIYGRAAEPRTGIRAIRFINNCGDRDYFHKESSELIRGHYFGGTTKIGTELHKRILKPLVLGETPMKKPLLIMVITDGAIEGEKKGLLEKVILNCVNKLNRDRKDGADSVAFQFSCIGNDDGARKVLQELDDHKVVGDYVNCQKATQSLDLSDDRPLMVTRLLLGAILYDGEKGDEELDNMMSDTDETGYGGRPGGPDSPGGPPGGPGGNPGYSNGSTDHNIHIPQGWDRRQGGEYGVAPEGQSAHNYQTNPHTNLPAPPAQNQGAPYPHGNGQSFPYQPEANPNPEIFGPDHSQPHFQENIPGYPPRNPSPNQGPLPGQAYPGLAQDQIARMGGQNIARAAQEEARRAVEEALRIAGEAIPGLSGGVPPTMTQDQAAELEELREEREDAESEGGHPLERNHPDVD